MKTERADIIVWKPISGGEQRHSGVINKLQDVKNSRLQPGLRRSEEALHLPFSDAHAISSADGHLSDTRATPALSLHHLYSAYIHSSTHTQSMAKVWHDADKMLTAARAHFLGQGDTGRPKGRHSTLSDHTFEPVTSENTQRVESCSD